MTRPRSWYPRRAILGATLMITQSFLFRGQPVIAGYGPDQLPPGGAGQLLAPWPNRIDSGRYTFDGTEFQLALSEPAQGAIHGLTRWAAWRAVRHDASTVLLRSVPHGEQGYPFCLGDRRRVPARGGHRAACRHHGLGELQVLLGDELGGKPGRARLHGRAASSFMFCDVTPLLSAGIIWSPRSSGVDRIAEWFL